MPKINADHRAARRQQILDAARRCFLREGIHATSIQDILTEADLSAGGVYIYFKSKEDIIEAVALDTITIYTQGFDEILAQTDLPPIDVALGRLVALMVAHDREQPIFQIIVQIWAILRSTPRLAERFTETQQQWEGKFRQLIERYQADGTLDRHIPAAHTTKVVIALIMGFVSQCAVLGTLDATAFQAGIHTLFSAQLHAPRSPPDHQD